MEGREGEGGEGGVNRIRAWPAYIKMLPSYKLESCRTILIRRKRDEVQEKKHT